METGSLADWFSGSMSALAVAVALLGYWIAGRQRKVDQRVRDETAARLLVMKIFQLVNRTDDIYRPLAEAAARPPMNGLWGDQKWRQVRGVTGIREDADLLLDASQEDMLIRLGEYSLIMSITLEISRYRTLVQHMRDYVVRRDALLELHPAPVEMDGVHAVLHMDRDDVMRVAPYANALEALIEEILEQADDNRTNTRALTPQCNDFVKKYFPKAKFPKLLPPKVDGEQPVT